MPQANQTDSHHPLPMNQLGTKRGWQHLRQYLGIHSVIHQDPPLDDAARESLKLSTQGYVDKQHAFAGGLTRLD